MKVGIIVFPWTTGSDDLSFVLKNLMALKTSTIWHKEADRKVFAGYDIVFIPDGFSDERLITPENLKQSPVINQLIHYVKQGGVVVGINNGFQILCQLNLLPGSLTINAHQRFVCRNVNVIAQHNDSYITTQADTKQPLCLPVAHSRGRYIADADTLKQMTDRKQILFRYCNPDGSITPEANPDGTTDNIAAICNQTKSVFGIMPHPERAADDELGNTDGMKIFNSLVSHF